MVIIGDEDRQEKQARLQIDYGYVPWEIWLEILSRLPIKSLLVCQAVCKLWSSISSLVRKNIGNVPLCGLLFRNLGRRELRKKIRTKYICFRNEYNNNGLLGDLSLDFSALSGALTASNCLVKKPASLVSHKGLILIGYSDGSHEIHNPLTKEVFEVPKSGLIEKHVTRTKKLLRESCGLVINLSDYPGAICRFVIVRFSSRFKEVEIYYSVTKRWNSMDNIGYNWARLSNYVALCKPTDSFSLYFRKDGDQVLASNFNNINSPTTMSVTQYVFPLPKAVHGEDRRLRTWESGNSLLLSYCSPAGLWVWKAGSTEVDTCAWVSYVVITITDEISKAVVVPNREKLVKFLQAGDDIKPIGWHPYIPVMYLSVKSFIFGYHITDDTLVKIAELNKSDELTGVFAADPFTPCITSIHSDDLQKHEEHSHIIDVTDI